MCLFVCAGLVLDACTDYTPFLSVSPAKLARLKQAKEEAEKEIAEFRAQIELEFQRKVLEVSIRIK
jgi:hypothetical protein